MASLVLQLAMALPAPKALIKVAPDVQSGHPEAYAVFMRAPRIILGDVARKRQAVPGDGNPDPNRAPITPDNIFVLQCPDAGFLGDCISFGAPPGRCVGYSSFNTTQAFLDKYDNQTSSLSTNTGGQCQFYKFTGCGEKGDDRGVALSYKYNLGVADVGYGGDYDNQISSWKC
ncbi:uncharacterized protein LY79DRAFT_579261 [Colletotrichum navitas]|uniref:Uncharacterized protein n=1 Tax=Colletotrichum navitas TaxID=681940 RepID=A0AAD8Q184_9PEZI|nr:uncharacterized protein LY79DRAFT_579261 [Colletotrichum navitas]KAK1593426.1 hypothetical protein LY79DRAFT_579261 [Colletotrichum navitas]